MSKDYRLDYVHVPACICFVPLFLPFFFDLRKSYASVIFRIEPSTLLVRTIRCFLTNVLCESGRTAHGVKTHRVQ